MKEPEKIQSPIIGSEETLKKNICAPHLTEQSNDCKKRTPMGGFTD